MTNGGGRGATARPRRVTRRPLDEYSRPSLLSLPSLLIAPWVLIRTIGHVPGPLRRCRYLALPRNALVAVYLGLAQARPRPPTVLLELPPMRLRPSSTPPSAVGRLGIHLAVSHFSIQMAI